MRTFFGLLVLLGLCLAADQVGSAAGIESKRGEKQKCRR